MASVIGFLVAIKDVLRLHEKGLLFGGVVCSSFIWLSSSNTKRSAAKPMGDQSNSAVVMGNLLAVRFCLLVLLAISRKCYWFIEQPGSSRLPGMPYYEPLVNYGMLLPHFFVRWPGAE
jgi:hypothetical protein